MAETTADVRRDIELTRERMSDTLAQLEQKVNVMQIVRDHPWPALAIAVGAGFALASTKSDVKAAAASLAATGGASSKIGSLLDDVAARLISGASDALNQRIDSWVGEIKTAIGASEPADTPEAGRSGGTKVDGQYSGAGAQRPGVSRMIGREPTGQPTGAMRV